MKTYNLFRLAYENAKLLTIYIKHYVALCSPCLMCMRNDEHYLIEHDRIISLQVDVSMLIHTYIYNILFYYYCREHVRISDVDGLLNVSYAPFCVVLCTYFSFNKLSEKEGTVINNSNILKYDSAHASIKYLCVIVALNLFSII